MGGGRGVGGRRWWWGCVMGGVWGCGMSMRWGWWIRVRRVCSCCMRVLGFLGLWCGLCRSMVRVGCRAGCVGRVGLGWVGVTWGTMTGGLASQRRFLLPEVVKSVAGVDGAVGGVGGEVVLAVTGAD